MQEISLGKLNISIQDGRVEVSLKEELTILTANLPVSASFIPASTTFSSTQTSASSNAANTASTPIVGNSSSCATPAAGVDGEGIRRGEIGDGGKKEDRRRGKEREERERETSSFCPIRTFQKQIQKV